MNRVCKNRKELDWAYTEKLKKYFPLAVVLCDLNGLKEINDQKGHDAGDKFIVQTEQTLKSLFGKRHVYSYYIIKAENGSIPLINIFQNNPVVKF